jgi:uncharacterized protein (DUF302 family)
VAAGLRNCLALDSKSSDKRSFTKNQRARFMSCPGVERQLIELPPQNMNAEGMINLASRFSVVLTANRLESILRAKGIKVFARIDQAAEAKAAGLSMPPMQLLIFGDPRAGTPLMLKYPSLAMDLPLKALVWESADGLVWLSYNAPEYLQARHHLDSPPFQAVAALLETATHD